MIKFQLLGPVELWSGQRKVDLGPARQRSVLAALLIEPDQPISMDELINRVWADSPPDGVRNVLYTYIARLRRALGTAGARGSQATVLLRDTAGYRLAISPDQVDLHRFRTLLTRARTIGPDDPERCRILGEALELWRGEPLAGLDNDWAARFRRNLQQLKNEALAEWADAEIRAGHGKAVIAELGHALVKDPMAELLHEQLIRALYHTGQSTEALSQYEYARRVIAEELGSDPGPRLRRVHQQVLCGDPVVTEHPAARPPSDGCCDAGPPAHPVPSGPNLLPMDLPDFAGRAPEVERFHRELTGTSPLPAVITLVGGAGVGKTALAAHIAHRLGKHFPDGRLYVDLRGSSDRPLRPVTVLARLLRALETDTTGLTDDLDDLDELTELYRNRLSGRRVLVVLDDATDDRQVLPLLPNGPGCGVVVTSRYRVTGPVSGRLYQVREMGPEQSLELLGRMIGADRVRAEEQAARHLAELCGGLPLALRAVANRLLARPYWTLAQILARIADEERRLAELAFGSLDLRDELAATYRRLDPAASLLFRRLGTMDATGVVRAEEVLPELPPEEAEGAVELLVDAHLVQITKRDFHGRAHYRIPELHRLFAKGITENREIRFDGSHAVAGRD